MVASKNRRKIANCETAFPFLTYGQQETRLGSLGYGEKNMKRKLIAVALLAMGGIALAAGGVASALHSPEPAVASMVDTTDVEWNYQINNLDDFKSVFNKGYNHEVKTNIKLNCDIDLAGVVLPYIAGEFNGIFDGGGHTISNFDIKAGKTLFNIIHKGGVLQNFTLQGNLNVAETSNLNIVSYQNEGKVSNVKVVAILNEATSFLSPIARHGTGTFEDITTYLVGRGNGATSTNLAAVRVEATTGATLTNCTYYVSGIDQAQVNQSPSDATYDPNADLVWAALAGDQSLEIGQTATITALTAGNPALVQYEWTASNDNVTLSEETATGVTVKGVNEGATTITLTYGQGASAITASLDLEVFNAAKVTGVKIESEDLSLETGLDADVTITLTGNTYTSVEWTSSDPTSVGVVGDATGAKISALAVTAEPATVTVSFYDGEDVLASDSIVVTVTDAVGFDVVYLAPLENKEGPSNNIDTAYVVIKGNHYVPMERIKVGDTPVQVNYEGAAYYLFKGFVGVTANEWANGTLFVYNHGLVGQWGIPLYPNNQTEDGTWSDIVAVAPGEGALPNKNIGSDVDAIMEAVDHVTDTLYSATWRSEDPNIGVCWYVDGNHDTELNALLTGYDGLSDQAELWARRFIDGEVTYGETIDVLRANANKNPEGTYVAANNAISFFGFDGNGNSSLMILALFAGLGTIVLVGGIAIYRHRKNRA